MEETPTTKKNRFLMQMLLLSVTLNVGLFTTFLYRSLSPKPVAWENPEKKTFEVTNGEMIYSYFHCSFDELVEKLADDRLVEEGYRVCDLALACLVSYHHFDLERALPKTRIQRRHLLFVHVDGGEQIDIPVFPGLSMDDFVAASLFAQREMWPLTPKGLFLQLCEGDREGLREAFFCTPAFLSAQTLFNREGSTMEPDAILDLLRDGGWDLVEKIREEKLFSKEQQLTILSALVDAGSEKAAQHLLERDREYALRKLSDATLAKLVQHTDDKELLSSVATGVRQDLVREAAQEKLGAAPQEAQEDLPKTYTVQKGDTLWHIAKRFGVTVKALEKANALANGNQIRPGKELAIPLQKP